jgi:5'-3' exonuclease|tara:strand:- start:1877 stop:2866 length:990 start_codon:yes stop_codon:yes gene_type:complete
MTKTNKKRLLIIDALNAYLRAYIVDPSISANGQPMGGMKGFIKILQKLVRDTSPQEIVIVWDGPNGSQKRKSMDKNYKAGRKPIRLNRAFHNLTDDEELHNKIWQQSRLIEYVNEMPIVQIMLPEIEADDVISYLTRMSHYDGWQKVIISNDKDFMQLCDDETVLFRPTKKEVMSMKTITEQIGVHPTNMALARAMAGDASDNLKGVKGAGLPTIAKRLPFLAESRTVTIDEVVDYCENTEHSQKFYENVVEAKELVEHNYNMMQLYSPQMSVQSKQKVDYAITEFECSFNKTSIIGMMMEDGFGELNWEDLKASLNKISVECAGTKNL